MDDQQLLEIEKRYIDDGLLFDDYRKMSVPETVNMRLAIKRLYKTVDWYEFDQY